MSVITTLRAAITCDALGCREMYQGSRGCDYAAEVRSEARAEGWRVSVPRALGPLQINPQPFEGARLDFCPQHARPVETEAATRGYQDYMSAVQSGALPPEEIPEGNPMTTNTSYGTCQQHTSDPSVRVAIEYALADHAGDFDMPAIEAEYRAALAELLPEGVTLNGDEFYGPYPMPEDADVAIQAAVEELKGDRFWEIVQRHDSVDRFVHERNGDKLVVRRYPNGDVYVSVTSPVGAAAVILPPEAGNGLVDYMRPEATNSGVLPAEEEPEGIR